MAGTIIFNTINVNAQETNAIVSVGQSNASNWTSHNKNQMSVGMIFNAFFSAATFPGNLNILNDCDVVDTVVNDGFDRQIAPSSQV